MPAAVGVLVTVLPEVLVPEPMQPPEVEIVTGSEAEEVAETVNVDPYVFVPGSLKVMVCRVNEVIVNVFATEPDS